MKLWGRKLNKQVEQYTVGNDYILDRELLKYDCIASIAHAKMLYEEDHLTKNEMRKLVKELEGIIKLDEQGRFKIKREDEDSHTAIENYLVKKLGKVGKKIHFARSRNDQVLTALRLYCRDKVADCRNGTISLIGSIGDFVERCGKVPFPGYTHTRKAMPSSILLWGGSFIEALYDDIVLLNTSLHLINQCPLGTGAGYGVPVKISRQYVARELGFRNVQTNPIYAQNSRGKFESTLLHSLSQIMFDLNKMSTDIILFSMPELGYLELPDEICTGSSIMPHKKNPDVLELVRASYHSVNACEFEIKNVISNLISTYNRDLQLTKEPLMRGIRITQESISIMKLVFEKLKVNKDKCKEGMTKELFATEEVYKLSRKMPFRDAYKKVKRRIK